MKLNLTQTAIEDLKPPKSGAKIYYDKAVSGFGARITYAGSVSFILNYVNAKGQERRCTIGHYPEMTPTAARNEANRLRSDIGKGADPLREFEPDSVEPPLAPASGQTVVDLANEYMAAMRTGAGRKYKRPKRAGSLRNDRGILANIITPRLGTMAVTAVTRDMIDELHDSRKATPYHANRMLSLLSAMFTFARKKGWRTDNPARDIERYREKPRKQYLTVEEATRLWDALDAYPNWLAGLKCRRRQEQIEVMRRDAQAAVDALQLLVLTGARKTEVLAAEWSQFNFELGLWVKPSDSTKQDQDEEPPLSNLALALLKRLYARRTNGHLFPGTLRQLTLKKTGETKDTGNPHRITLARPWKQALKAAGLADHKPKWRIHDLRHFFATALLSGGETQLPIIGKLLGHSQAQTTARYAHVANQPQRDAVNRIGKLFEPSTKKPRRPGARTPKRRSTTVTR